MKWGNFARIKYFEMSIWDLFVIDKNLKNSFELKTSTCPSFVCYDCEKMPQWKC